MYIEAATERSVLVELSAAELRKWNLTYDALDLQNAQTKAVVRQVLCEIQTRTGRTLPQQGIEIDLLPARGGGCLFIVSGSPALCEPKPVWEVCVLENENALLDLLALLDRKTLISLSAALYMFDHTYYLAVCNADEPCRRLLREFGEMQTLSAQQLAYLREYAPRSKILGGACAQL